MWFKTCNTEPKLQVFHILNISPYIYDVKFWKVFFYVAVETVVRASFLNIVRQWLQFEMTGWYIWKATVVSKNMWKGTLCTHTQAQNWGVLFSRAASSSRRNHISSELRAWWSIYLSLSCLSVLDHHLGHEPCFSKEKMALKTPFANQDGIWQ